MIPSAYRLRLRSNQPFVGSKQFENWVVLVSKPAAAPRWAIRVSKKIDHRAVVRNTLRRQINFWLFRQADKLTPQEFLVIVRKKPQTADELHQLFNAIGHALHLV